MKRPKSPSPGGKPPISRHPLFPAIVATWFAALFGLGSLALRPALLEALVVASRIDLALPAAAPPFGIRARLVVALALAAVGALLGTKLGRLIAAPRPAAGKTAVETAGAEEEGIRLRPRDSHPDAPARRPLSPLTDLVDSAGIAPEIAFPAAGRRRPLALAEPVEDLPGLTGDAPLPGIPECAPDLSGNPDSEADGEFVETADRPRVDVKAVPVPRPPFPFATGTAADRIRNAPLDALSHVELIERLALSLQARREGAAGVATQGFDAPSPLIVRPPEGVAVIPAALRPLDFTEDEGEEDVDVFASFLPPRASPPCAAGAGEEDEVEEDGGGGDTYSSLLAINRHTPRRFDAPPPLPAMEQATGAPISVSATQPRDSAATEEALRAALTSLQRMSGAA